MSPEITQFRSWPANCLPAGEENKRETWNQICEIGQDLDPSEGKSE